MKPPAGEFMDYPVVESTQDVAKESLLTATPAGVIFAHHQAAGRGRFKRTWESKFGDSLTMSMILDQYPDHKEPWLVGMSIAVAVAGVLHAQLQWPNDVILGGKKVAGILTEIHPNSKGEKIPIVGIGINLNQTEFPDSIAHRATSLKINTGKTYEAESLARQIVLAIENAPEPSSWDEIAPVWMIFDKTAGKQYQLPNGVISTAIGLGPNGQLICSVEGETTSVLAADAIFG